MAKKFVEDEEIIRIYNEGGAINEMAKKCGMGRHNFSRRLHALKDQVKIKSKSEQLHANSLALHDKITELVKQGKSNAQVAAEANTSIYTVSKVKTELYKKGIITKAENPNRERMVYRQNPTRFIKVGCHVNVPSTLPEGETVKCTRATANKCVYGNKDYYLCNYALITGKCRSLGGSGCDYKACNKFSRVSKDNPHIEISL